MLNLISQADFVKRFLVPPIGAVSTPFLFDRIRQVAWSLLPRLTLKTAMSNFIFPTNFHFHEVGSSHAAHWGSKKHLSVTLLDKKNTGGVVPSAAQYTSLNRHIILLHRPWILSYDPFSHASPKHHRALLVFASDRRGARAAATSRVIAFRVQRVEDMLCNT